MVAIPLPVKQSSARDTPHFVRSLVGAREDDGGMTAPTVEAAIHELLDLAWNVVYDLLEERGLLGDKLFVEEYTGIHSWLAGPARYTIVHSHPTRFRCSDWN